MLRENEYQLRGGDHAVKADRLLATDHLPKLLGEEPRSCRYHASGNPFAVSPFREAKMSMWSSDQEKQIGRCRYWYDLKPVAVIQWGSLGRLMRGFTTLKVRP